MRIKIISDGNVTNTRIVNAETGELLEGITAFEIKGNVDDVVVTAILEFTQVVLEVTAVGDKVVQRHLVPSAFDAKRYLVDTGSITKISEGEYIPRLGRMSAEV